MAFVATWPHLIKIDSLQNQAEVGPPSHSSRPTHLSEAGRGITVNGASRRAQPLLGPFAEQRSGPSGPTRQADLLPKGNKGNIKGNTLKPLRTGQQMSK